MTQVHQAWRNSKNGLESTSLRRASKRTYLIKGQWSSTRGVSHGSYGSMSSRSSSPTNSYLSLTDWITAVSQTKAKGADLGSQTLFGLQIHTVSWDSSSATSWSTSIVPSSISRWSSATSWSNMVDSNVLWINLISLQKAMPDG